MSSQNERPFFTFKNPQTIRTSPSFDLTEIKQFVREEVIPRTAHHDETSEFDIKLAKRLRQLGLLSLAVPRDCEGPGMSLSDLCWVTRELAYGSGGLTFTFIGNILGLSPVVLMGTDEQRRRLAPRALKDGSLWSLAMTEAQAGSDLAKIVTTATPVPGGFRLNGEKNYITNGTRSTHMCVFAAVPSPEGGQVTCFYVAGDSAGLSRGKSYRKLGVRESDTGQIFFKDVFIPEEDMIGGIGKGILTLGKCLERSKTLLAAAAMGLARRSMDLALDHLSTTQRGNRPLIEHHAIRHVLSRLAISYETGWLLACKASSLWDQGESIDLESSMAKAYCTDAAFQIANECLELHGSVGFLAESETARILRDLKGLEIVEGPTLIQENLIAKALIRKPMVAKLGKVA